ncbi:MAG: UDP-N-acetylmuramate:L-alanyl-gamma-D-glutamyl-meso-diaminopimelate ligase [Methylococcales bacterium]
MHIHILGICGTFMGGIAQIAKQLGHEVSGTDQNIYPPMSTQLEALDIRLMSGYQKEHLELLKPDLVVIGNALSRGNPAVEYILNRGLRYCSGPQWLSEAVLRDRWVLAVAGTHGKTTTASMLAWILDYNNYSPGFLIGGIPLNFTQSARLGESDFFVIEADEYDTAFFDKRSKFVHYHPNTVVLNNLEYDHADIFPDLEAIKRQFHHLVRLVPEQGLIIAPSHEDEISSVLSQGCWTTVERSSIGGESEWNATLLNPDGSDFRVTFEDKNEALINWNLTGLHNVTNALSAIAAARNVGISVADSSAALNRFENVKRRMEVIYQKNGITVYDDFAHHPTAIQTTLAGLRQKVGDEPIIAIVEPASNSMKQGIHQNTLGPSLKEANIGFIYRSSGMQWDMAALEQADKQLHIMDSIDEILAALVVAVKGRCHILIMSNGHFEGLYNRLKKQLDIA